MENLMAGISHSKGNQFIVVTTNGRILTGKPFKVEHLQLVDSINDLPEDGKIFKTDEVVYVTYSSSNHFPEAKVGLESIRNHTKAPIIFYDVGLDPEQVEELKKGCNIEVIRFPFENYPSHVKNLTTYAFKAIIMAESLKKYKAFWAIDSSVRFGYPRGIRAFYIFMKTHPAAPLQMFPVQHNIRDFTHPGTYDYLPMAEDDRTRRMMGATYMFVTRTAISKEIIRWHLLCGLEENCIAPPKSSPACPSNESRVCHRFDQSSLTIIHCGVNRRHGLPCSNYTTEKQFNPMFFVDVEGLGRENITLTTCDQLKYEPLAITVQLG